jgi:O-antigen/teichoic acid export membrane protein
MALEIIRVLFGPQWDAAAPIAAILSVSAMISSVFALGPVLLVATGHVRKRLRVSVLASSIHVCAVILAARFGMWVVAAAWGVTYSVTLFLYVRELRAIVSVGLADIVRATYLSGIVACISLAAQAPTAIAVRRYDLPELVGLVAVMLAGAIAWFGAVFATAHPIRSEIVRILSSLRPSQTD